MFEFTVTFVNSYDQERVIGCSSGEDEKIAHQYAWDIIMRFLDDHSYTSYYQRVTQMTQRGIENVEWIDVGSHTEFFYIYPVSKKIVEEQIKKSKIEPAYN